MGVDDRRQGTHVSDLIFCVRQAWLNRRRDADVSDRTILEWMRGRSHEDLMAGEVRQFLMEYCPRCRTTRHYENVRESRTHCEECGTPLLLGTVDWLDEGIVECKSTMKSSRKGLEDVRWYADQALTYAWMYGLDSARVVIYHVRGDYTSNRPELVVYTVAFEEGERERWEETILRRKALLEGDELPPLDGVDSPVYDWICGYCTHFDCPAFGVGYVPPGPQEEVPGSDAEDV